MKHLLVPTDFSIQSLNAVHAAVAAYKGEILKITMFHLLNMPGDISGFLFSSLKNQHLKLAGPDFKEACEILHNRYSSCISAINIKFGFGNTVAYVENLLEGEQVDRVVICSDINLGTPSKDSVDAIKLIKKTDIPIDVLQVVTAKKLYADMDVINMLGGNKLKVPKTERRYAIEE